jgi:hypothetical protein
MQSLHLSYSCYHHPHLVIYLCHSLPSLSNGRHSTSSYVSITCTDVQGHTVPQRTALGSLKDVLSIVPHIPLLWVSGTPFHTLKGQGYPHYTTRGIIQLKCAHLRISGCLLFICRCTAKAFYPIVPVIDTKLLLDHFLPLAALFWRRPIILIYIWVWQ